MSPEAISTCCSMSSLRPCAATTASSRVGGSRRTRTGRSGSHFRLVQSLLNEEGRCLPAHPPTGVIQQHAIGAGYRTARLSLTWSSWPLWSYLCQPLLVAPLSALRSSETVLVGAMVRAHDPAAGLGADLNNTVRSGSSKIPRIEVLLEEIAVVGMNASL